MARRADAQLFVAHQLCPFLDQESLCLIIHVLIISHLNNCNSVQMEAPFKSTWKFQLVQNLTNLRQLRNAEQSTFVVQVHWVPVCFWVKFKMLAMTFKALHFTGPGYLWNHPHSVTLAHPSGEAGRCAESC